jgi:hypothetical protein
MGAAGRRSSVVSLRFIFLPPRFYLIPMEPLAVRFHRPSC